MNVLTIIFIIIIILSTLALLYVMTYNKLQYYRTRIEISENNIDETIRHKYDLICDINADIKSVITNKDYLKEYIDMKNQRLTNYESDRKLVQAVNIIRELVNDHNKLNTKEIKNKLNKIRTLDETLTSSKNFFNKYTTELNQVIRIFPTNIVAKNHKFKIKPYFDNKNMQDAVIDDFKL